MRKTRRKAGKKAAAARIAALEIENAKLRTAVLFFSKALVAARSENEILKVDPLTGLYRRNARSEDEIVSHLIEAQRNEWAAVVMVFDLDNLKTVNDSFGHKAGDLILTAAAAALRKCFRMYDLLYRWGGDEFVAVITFDPKGQDPLSAANVVKDRINKCLEEADCKYPISVSCGMSEISGIDFGAAFEKADARMYAEKEERKSRGA